MSGSILDYLGTTWLEPRINIYSTTTIIVWSSYNPNVYLNITCLFCAILKIQSLQSSRGETQIRKKVRIKKGSCQVNKSQQISTCMILKGDLSFDYFPIETNQHNIPISYLLNLQLLQKEREERHGKRFVMDSSRMTMADKSIANMGTCGVHWMVSSSWLKRLVSLL